VHGFDFYRDVIGNPKYVLAPMVDASELPWRMMCRGYGAQLCYSPMLAADAFATSEKYRQQFFSTCPQDRPLIVQFCGHDPEMMLKAAKWIEGVCDAVDINLGCPQNIAKRGYYGAFLLDNWPLLQAMVSTLHQNLSIPVCCKIRLLPELQDTIALAQLLEKSGCQLLTVHGRTKDNKGRFATPADWNAIRVIKKSVAIPVVANGSICQFKDIEECLATTEADGAMVAYPALLNPAFFSGKTPDRCELALEYLVLCEKYPVHHRMTRGHIFKMLREPLDKYEDLRETLDSKKTVSVESMRAIVLEIARRLQVGMGPVKGDERRSKKRVKLYNNAENEDHFVADMFAIPDAGAEDGDPDSRDASE